MLDSGGADTWYYEHGPQGGIFVRNDSPLTQDNESPPYQRGEFHRTRGEAGAGLYINTNKTADINKDENDKGYVIPWAHPDVLYWKNSLAGRSAITQSPNRRHGPALTENSSGARRPIPRFWRHAGRPASSSAIQRAKGMTSISPLRKNP
jgi:hypothetical protein